MSLKRQCNTTLKDQVLMTPTKGQWIPLKRWKMIDDMQGPFALAEISALVQYSHQKIWSSALVHQPNEPQECWVAKYCNCRWEGLNLDLQHAQHPIPCYTNNVTLEYCEVLIEVLVICSCGFLSIWDQTMYWRYYLLNNLLYEAFSLPVANVKYPWWSR